MNSEIEVIEKVGFNVDRIDLSTLTPGDLNEVFRDVTCFGLVAAIHYIFSKANNL